MEQPTDLRTLTPAEQSRVPLGRMHQHEVTVFYPDLSSYTDSTSDEPMLNVGWLAAGHPVDTGDVDALVRDELVRLARSPHNLMRGFHYCEFCDEESPIVATTHDDPGTPALLGSGEIRVQSSGVTYVAPTLVIHYIDAHSYVPPTAFCAAVGQRAARR